MSITKADIRVFNVNVPAQLDKGWFNVRPTTFIETSKVADELESITVNCYDKLEDMNSKLKKLEQKHSALR